MQVGRRILRSAGAARDQNKDHKTLIPNIQNIEKIMNNGYLRLEIKNHFKSLLNWQIMPVGLYRDYPDFCRF